MKNYCLVIICVNKPFNCVIRLITIMIHNIRRNNSTIFNTMTEIFVFRVVDITMDIAVDARSRNAMKLVRISRKRFAVM